MWQRTGPGPVPQLGSHLGTKSGYRAIWVRPLGSGYSSPTSNQPEHATGLRGGAGEGTASATAPSHTAPKALPTAPSSKGQAGGPVELHTAVSCRGFSGSCCQGDGHS